MFARGTCSHIPLLLGKLRKTKQSIPAKIHYCPFLGLLGHSLGTRLLIINLVVNCSDNSSNLSIFPKGSLKNHLSVNSLKLARNILHITALSKIQKAITYL